MAARAAAGTFDDFLAAELNGLQDRLLAEHERRLAARDSARPSESGEAEEGVAARGCERNSSYAFLGQLSESLGMFRAAAADGRTSSESAVDDDSNSHGDAGSPAQYHSTGTVHRVHLAPIDDSRHPSKERDHESKKGSSKETVSSCYVHKLKPAWVDALSEEMPVTRRPGRKKSAGKLSVTSFRTADYFRSGEDEEAETWLERQFRRRCCISAVHPNSKGRMTWDVIGMLLLAWGLVWTPLQTFEPDPTLFTIMMDWVHLIFWSIDLPASFLVGYFTHGRLVTNLAKVAKAYLRSWFALDVLLVTVDWFIVVLDGSEENPNDAEALGLFRVGKVVRIIRMMRVVRLLRLLKLRKYFLQVEERIQSRHVLVSLGIVKVLVMILVINHIVACLWWLTGVTSTGGGYPTWLTAHETVPDIQSESFVYKYTTSLHWSLTQFTPAAMEVYATNPLERIVSAVVIVFALITFSSFVSSITKAMNDLGSLNNEEAEQLLMFQRFIQSRKISTELSVRMRRHLGHRLVREKARIEEKEVFLLTMLSKPLLMEMHTEVYTGSLDVHPFFKKYHETNVMGIRRMCHLAIEEVNLARQDMLFSEGDRASKVYFVQAGVVAYTPSIISITENVYPCSDGQGWLCEGCLWTEWTCYGDAEGEVRSTLLALDSVEFGEVVRSCRGGRFAPARYGQLFVEHLNTLQEEGMTDLPLRYSRRPDDLCSPDEAEKEEFDEAQAVEDAIDWEERGKNDL